MCGTIKKGAVWCCADGAVAWPHQHQLEAVRQFTLTHPLRINLNPIVPDHPLSFHRTSQRNIYNLLIEGTRKLYFRLCLTLMPKWWSLLLPGNGLQGTPAKELVSKIFQVAKYNHFRCIQNILFFLW